jgi:hypothetical protein
VPGSVSAGSTGFSARALNPSTSFTAARSFGSACPAETTLAPARAATIDRARPADPIAGTRVSEDARALLGFTLPPAATCDVAAARLELEPAPAAPLAVYRLGSAWDEETTWETRPGVTGAAVTGTSGLDITSQLRAIYRYGDNGLLVRYAGGAGEEYVPASVRLVVSFE